MDAPWLRRAWLLVAGVLLSWHGSSGPHLFDSGELVTAAWLLGGSHPPGQALHALLGHGATLLPFGSIPWRVSVLSAFTVVAAAWFAASTVTALIASMPAETAPPGPTYRVVRWTRRAAPDAAALAIVIAPPVLGQSMRPEVYGLALCLFCASVLHLVRWGQLPHRDHRPLMLAALGAGLAATVHPPHALAAVAAGAAVLACARLDVLKRPQALAWTATACGVGLLVLIYLPLRARADAPMWGTPARWDGFLDYVTAKAYRQNVGIRAQTIGAHIAELLTYVTRASGVLPWLGLLVWIARPPALNGAARGVLVALPLVTATALITPFDATNPDVIAYCAPAVVLLLIAATAGCASGGRRRFFVVAQLSLLIAIGAHASALRRVPRAFAAADPPTLDAMAAAAWDTPPPRSLVVAETDFIASAWWLGRSAYGARPDVALLVTGLTTSSWHWKSLAPHPAFDGRPIRGGGADDWERYTNGGVRGAAGRVAITSEPTGPTQGQGAVAGPYLVWTTPAAAETVARIEDSTGERLLAQLGKTRAAAPVDSQYTGAVMRYATLDRAERLAARGLTSQAMEAVSTALRAMNHPVPEDLETIAGPLRAPLAPHVRDPGGFLSTEQDAVRQAAILLWALGARPQAATLLRQQLGAGDPRAVLQLAWLHASVGNRTQAEQALADFTHAVPMLAKEGDGLRAALARPEG